jgi:hypothetical protein
MKPGDSEQVHQAGAAEGFLYLIGEGGTLSKQETVSQAGLNSGEDLIQPLKELLAKIVPKAQNTAPSGADPSYLGFTIDCHCGKDPLASEVGAVIEVVKTLRRRNRADQVKPISIENPLLILLVPKAGDADLRLKVIRRKDESCIPIAKIGVGDDRSRDLPQIDRSPVELLRWELEGLSTKPSQKSDDNKKTNEKDAAHTRQKDAGNCNPHRRPIKERRGKIREKRAENCSRCKSERYTNQRIPHLPTKGN